MRKFIALLLVLGMVTSFGGCGAEAGPTYAGTTTAETAAPKSTAAEAEETQPILEGSLFLTVSSITFSLVGEAEDVYLGLIPRELVTWESEDPDIISVDEGVLTAVGVGTTVIHASYDDREVSCTASCLAQTQEELALLDPDILSEPKRLPPDVDLSVPCTYFDNAAIVGDSITYMMMQYENKDNALGDILFLARGGVSMRGFVYRYKNIYFQGHEMYLEDAIASSQVERVYFLIGSNDVGANLGMDVIMDNWRTMLDRIWEKSPGLDIVLISSIPKYVNSPGQQSSGDYNAMTVEYNANLRQFAQENGCKFLDLHAYIEDQWGRMSIRYNVDNYHLNEQGCINWLKVMRYYAQYESEGGILE